METEINHLLKRSESFEDVLKSLASTNYSLKFYFIKLKTKIVDCRNVMGVPRKNTCSICYTRLISIVNIPCGHLICQDCAERVMQRKKCFTCRCEVRTQHKVFI